MREEDESRKKVAKAPTEQEIAGVSKETEVDEEVSRAWNFGNIMAMIDEVPKVKKEAEEQALKEGKRVEKGKRMKIWRQCCTCKATAAVNSEGKTSCCHHLCATCY